MTPSLGRVFVGNGLPLGRFGEIWARGNLEFAGLG